MENSLAKAVGDALLECQVVERDTPEDALMMFANVVMDRMSDIFAVIKRDADDHSMMIAASIVSHLVLKNAPKPLSSAGAAVAEFFAKADDETVN